MAVYYSACQKSQQALRPARFPALILKTTPAIKLLKASAELTGFRHLMIWHPRLTRTQLMDGSLIGYTDSYYDFPVCTEIGHTS